MVTGLSGAGKHSVLGALEDMGCTALDNVPAWAMRPLLDVESRVNPGRRLVVGMDSRQEAFAEAFESLVAEVREKGVALHVIFLEASDAVLVRRFSETRRPHPLAQERGVPEAIQRERELMAPVRAQATAILDSSELTLSQLRHRVAELVPALGQQGTTLRLLSFGFKRGLPTEADVVLDARFLPNPHYIQELRPLTGRDAPVLDFLGKSEAFHEFLDRAEDWLRWSLPQVQAEGRAYHTVAVGCTGGQHRSVALVESLARRLEGLAPRLAVEHREL